MKNPPRLKQGSVAYSEQMRARMTRNRGFTDEDVVQYVNAGHNYTETGRHFNRSGSWIALIVKGWHRRQAAAADREVVTQVLVRHSDKFTADEHAILTCLSEGWKTYRVEVEFNIRISTIQELVSRCKSLTGS